MAYVPPHKRNSKDADRPTPTPGLPTPRFQKKMNNLTVNRPKNFVPYANDSVNKWFASALELESHFLSALRLVPISIKFIEHKKPMMLVIDNNLVEDKKVIKDGLKSPWESMFDQVMEDLIFSYVNLKKVEGYEANEVSPKLFARVGKVIFQGNASLNMETEKSAQVDENSLSRMVRLFRTNVPTSYVKYITDEVVSMTGLDFEEEKELYSVKLFDSNMPNYTISCKCRVMKDINKLELYKIELNQMRHMVADISFLDRDLDLRLMLCSKKYLTISTEKEKNDINSLITSAVIDPCVKGGLRWSIGKDSSGDRYKVIGVWHTTTKSYTSPLIRLRVRKANRTDFRTFTGEVTQEVTIRMNGILSRLQEKDIRTDLVGELLKKNIKLICAHFLCCDSLIN